MKIHVCTPFDVDKNLAKAYNEAFENCPDDDWLCVIDYDVCFLTPNSIPIMYEYIKSYPDAGMFVCRTNRIHRLQLCQLADDVPSDNDSIGYWMQRAEEAEKWKGIVSNVTGPVSGFLMLVSKKTWMENKIPENLSKCLGVDNQFSKSVLSSGKRILCMEGLLVWHTYRLRDITDKSHLH